mgnify:CR=1 FL=1
MQYTIQGWRTPIGEFRSSLFELTFGREWVLERNCWRDVLVGHRRLWSESDDLNFPEAI